MLGESAQDRIAALPIAIIGQANLLCRENNVALEKFRESDLFLGYLAGFPAPFDNLGEALGGVVRKVLFDVIHQDDGSEFVRRAIRLINQGDPDAKIGFGFGASDGQRFFQALGRGTSAEDCTDSLRAMFDIRVRRPTLPDTSMSFDELRARKEAISERLSRSTTLR